MTWEEQAQHVIQGDMNDVYNFIVSIAKALDELKAPPPNPETEV